MALPFGYESFDVSCSFKVLAHIPQIELALAEMARVVRPGGHVLAELYNPLSWRGLAKAVAPAGRVATDAKESDVFTRFDTPREAVRLTPSGCTFAGARGIRILTPTAHLMRVPGLRQALRVGERWLCDTPLKAFGGFYVAAYRKG
jgi:SAM-dependent methyltransferase